MGDDAELWIQTGGDPTILIRDSYDYQENTMVKKKNTMVFIDAENISADRCTRIIGQCAGIGEIYEIRYYARQNDPATAAWKSEAKKYGIKAILMSGGPSHNKIDDKIVKDIHRVLGTNKSIDIFCIASRDGDFAGVVRELKEKHKRVVVLAAKNTSAKLKACASEVKGI